jgi:hypothetical protein
MKKKPPAKNKPAKKKVSDRAKRYRANNAVSGAEQVCAYCGAAGAGDVEHIDGDENNNAPYNLVRACRSCNVKKGRAFAAAGVGVRTVQMNPAGGITSAPAYRRVVGALLGSGGMSLRAAIRAMQATPSKVRQRFARNPGAKTMAQYVAAGQLAHDTGDAAAKKLVDDTPMSRKKRFSKQVWDIRRQRYGPSGRRDGGAIPF